MKNFYSKNLKIFTRLFLCLASCFLCLNSYSQKPDKTLTRILFIFDGSQSMQGRWEDGKKVDIAQQMMTKMLDSLQSLQSEDFQLALRMYGHQKPVPPQDCNDTKLEVPFKFGNIGRIKSALRQLSPKGTTPIARSISLSANDFPPCENCRNIIILITDGVEACDEDPCAASRLLQKKGITLKPFVIGIGIDDQFKQTFECVGNYYDASDSKTFENVLDVVISQALDNTTAQINLLDENNRPTETDIPITFYDEFNGMVKTQLVHTLNYKKQPDTIYLDPLISYKMTVHSIPEKTLNNIDIKAGKHSIIETPLSRGILKLLVGQRSEDLLCIIRESEKREILHVQSFNTEQKYLDGKYAIEILTLPRILKEIEIKGGQTETIAVPPAGRVNFNSSSAGYGAVLLENGNELEWVLDLDTESSRQSIDLQPGNYRIIFRTKSAQQSSYSKIVKFTVASGEVTMVKLN